MSGQALVVGDHGGAFDFTATSASASSRRDKGGVVYPLRATSEEERAYWVESCNSVMSQLEELCAMRKLARDTVSTENDGSSHDLSDLGMSKHGECRLM